MAPATRQPPELSMSAILLFIHAGVVVPQWHRPQRVTRSAPRGDQVQRQLLAVAEQRRQVGAQRGYARAAPAASVVKIQDQFRRRFRGVAQCIAQDHATFGVGVADFY